ncbi:MAG: nucleoside transporter C-terminal domain-containing protein, partial [Bradyrhizobium guangdongense]
AAGMDLAPKLITASLMAAPGALVIAKIVFPETEESQTMGTVKLEVKSEYSNVIDAVSHGAGDGFKIAMNVIAMLIGFIAVIACIDWALTGLGHLCQLPFDLTLNWVLGKLFYPMAWAMGVPSADISSVATLLGQKITVNEFVAFQNLTNHSVPIVTDKGLLILSIAICGFANFSSVGMQIGGIGALAADKSDKAHWIAVGRACQRFGLQATALGLKYAFVNQPVEVAALRRQFAASIGLGERRPDLVMRFGAGPDLPKSLRRAPEQVMAG